MFVRYESFGQYIRYYPVVSVLMGIHLLCMILNYVLPATYPPPLYNVLYFWGIGWNEAVAAGQYWRLITPIFLHGDLTHFLFNTFSLFIFAPALEKMLGHVKFIMVYLFAGFLGNLGTFLFEPSLHYLHLGASGAIYGLLGVYLYMKYFRQDLIDPSSAQIITTLLIIGAIYTVVMVRQINLLGHLFGFIGGVLAAPIAFKGRVKYFSMVNTAGYKQSHQGQEEIGFDPKRWEKSRRQKKILKNVLIGLFILFILVGLWQRFF